MRAEHEGLSMRLDSAPVVESTQVAPVPSAGLRASAAVLLR